MTQTPRKTSARKAPAKKAAATRARNQREHADFLEQAFIATQARLQLYEQQLEALHFVMRSFGHGGFNSTSDIAARGSADPLFTMVYQRIVTAQRDVLAFGSLLGGDALNKAKYMAYLHFLNERYSIMHMLNSHGGYEGSWRTADEQAFKAQIAAAMRCTHAEHDHGQCRTPDLIANIHDLEQELLLSKERYEAFVGELTSFERGADGS